MRSRSISFWRGVGDLFVGLSVVFVITGLVQFLFSLFFPEIESQELHPESYSLYYLMMIGTQVFGFGLPAWLLIRLQLREKPLLSFRLPLWDFLLIVLIVGGELLFLNLLKIPYEIYEQFLPPELVSKFRQISQFQNEFLQILIPNQPLPYSLLALAIIPAICEELLFRNYLLRSLYRFMPLWLSILISSFLFAFFHMEMEGLLARFLLGVILAILFAYRDFQLTFPILLHFFHNAIQTILVYYLPREYENLEGQLSPIVSGFGLILFVVSLGLFIQRRN